jgi:predicted transcriptional regulator of viral defense system
MKTVYSWKVEDEYSIISGLKNNSYFSHRTAMFLNRFIEIEPEIIYLNHEHKVQENDLSNTLNQIAIDRAFSVDQRIVTSYYSFKNYKIQILNGKGTNNLGVMKEKGKFFEYTDAERTLIDIAVRPAYAGGVSAVLEAFKKAKECIDIKKLALYLHTMNFIYPYHQVVGFYLEKAGYNESSLELFDTRMDYKFFLTYNMKNKLFSKRWQLYYPKELK